MMKRVILYIIIMICAIAIVIGIPLAIDRCIIGNSYPSYISNSDWVTFLSGYTGSILSMIGIIITIRFTNKQNKLDRENQSRPYCIIERLKSSERIPPKKSLCFITIGCGKVEDMEQDCQEYFFRIKNIGVGPAIEFDFDIEELEDDREHYLFSIQRSSDEENSSINSLVQNEEGLIRFSVRFNFEAIPNEKITLEQPINTDEEFYSVKPEVYKKYKEHDLVLQIRYYDMYQNEFAQKMTLHFSASPIIDHNGHAYYEGGYYLKDVSNPVRAKNRGRRNHRFFGSGISSGN